MDGQPLCREPMRSQDADRKLGDHTRLIIRAAPGLMGPEGLRGEKVYVASASRECLSGVGDAGVMIEQAGRQERQRSPTYRGRFSRTIVRSATLGLLPTSSNERENARRNSLPLSF